MEKILIDLANTTLNYKGVKTSMFGTPISRNYSKNSIKSTMYRLNKQGFIEKKDNNWQVAHLGKKYLKRKEESLRQFNSSFNKKSIKNLILMFDIPEKQRAEREWFRWHLKKFNYVMIQKSVWVGPSPLPKDFMDYISKIGLKNNIKTFKLAKNYNF